MAIGRRLGLRIDGLGFPHHFMARYSDPEGAWLLDPFNGVVLELEEASAHLSRLIRRPIQLAPRFFEPVSAVELTARILNNLRAAYTTHPDPQRLLLVLGFQCALEPSQPLVWRERSVLHYHLQHWEEAAHDLRRYFYLLGALPYLFPEEARSVYTLPELATDDRKGRREAGSLGVPVDDSVQNARIHLACYGARIGAAEPALVHDLLRAFAEPGGRA